MIDVLKIKKLNDKIKLNKEKLVNEKDGRKKQILLLKIRIKQLEIQIERLK